MATHLRASDLPDHLLSQGRFSASTEEISDLTGIARRALGPALKRLRDRQLAFSPARGLYCFVPPEYRSWGVTPGTWMIDDTMRHLGRDYYVGLLSAAELHGAAHHAPQVFQVLVGVRTADRDIGRLRLRFVLDAHLDRAAVGAHNVPTGTIRVATREQTAVDLVAHHHHAGGWNNVATVLAELEGLEGDELARLAAYRPLAQARRLGWLLDRFAPTVDTAPLVLLARRPSAPPTLLEPAGARVGELDERWALIVNTDVQPDL
jgi:predicted transcriptional regulator of viral defense system